MVYRITFVQCPTSRNHCHSSGLIEVHVASWHKLESANPLGVAEDYCRPVPVAVDQEVTGVLSVHLETINLLKSTNNYFTNHYEETQKRLSQILSSYWSYPWHSTAERIVLLTFWFFNGFLDIWKAVDPCQEHHKSPPRRGSNES